MSNKSMLHMSWSTKSHKRMKRFSQQTNLAGEDFVLDSNFCFDLLDFDSNFRIRLAIISCPNLGIFAVCKDQSYIHDVYTGNRMHNENKMSPRWWVYITLFFLTDTNPQLSSLLLTTSTTANIRAVSCLLLQPSS